jgi:hypothetical protein
MYFWGILRDFWAEIFRGFFYYNLEFLGDFFQFELETLAGFARRGSGKKMSSFV